jgi:methionyl-tRNA formyltransferase
LAFTIFITDDVWPSYPGPDPIRDMVRDGKTHVVITMHEVTAVLDDGAAFARSHKVPLPPDANAVKVHRIAWPQMGPFIRRQVSKLLNLDRNDRAMALHEEAAGYFV